MRGDSRFGWPVRAWLPALLMLTAAVAASTALGLLPEHQAPSRNLSYLSQTCFLIAAIIATGAAVARLRGRQRLAWMSIAAALVAELIPEAALTVAVVFLGKDAHSVDAVQPVAMLAVPLGLAGASLMISVYVELGRLRTVLDALIATSGIYIIAWATFLGAAYQRVSQVSGPDATDALVSLMGDVAYIMVLTFLIIRAHPRDRLPLVFFVFGVLGDATSNLLALLLPGLDPGAAGQPADVFSIIALLGVGLGGVAVEPITTEPRPERERRRFSLATIPYVAVVLAAVSIGVAASRGSISATLVWSGVGSVLLLSLRQWLALEENEHLTSALATREQRFRELVQRSSDMTTVLDAEGVVLFVSPASIHVLGIYPQQIEGRPLYDLLHADDRTEVASRIAACAAGEMQREALRVRIRDRDGAWRVVEALLTNLTHVPAVGGIVLNTRDITDRKSLEDQLVHEAFHDPLTGLANRALFHNRLAHALARRAHPGDRVALLFLDVDDFKTINDSLGHVAGDELLRAVGARISGCLRASDTPARFGADEFAILLEDEVNHLMATKVASRVLRAVEVPLTVGGETIKVRATIGIAMSGLADTPADIVRHADAALHRAKEEAAGHFALFDHSMEEKAHQRLRLMQDLTRALERNEFVLHYQPIVGIARSTAVGVEALVRWQHPERGMVPPGEFIPAAERTDLIIALGQWVLHEACAQAKRWQQLFPDRAPLSMSVNIAARHLQTAGFVEDVLAALHATQVDPSRLVLELTESAVIADLKGSMQRLQAVKEVGVRVALDDFGTGYASFGYLRDLPVDYVKIDRSFVIDLGRSSRGADFIRAIQSLCTSLHLRTTAEGVEEKEQLAELGRLGIDHAQGYLFSRPMEADALHEFLASHLPVDVADIADAQTA